MNVYLYKGYDMPGIFGPDNLVVAPFLFPKSVISVLEGDERPVIFVFKSVPTAETVREFKLTKSIILEGLEEDSLVDDLKMMMKPINFWRMVALF